MTVGLRVAPREIELVTAWAFHQPAAHRVWVLQAEQWGDTRADSRMTIAVQLAQTPKGGELPDTDTSVWEEQLNGLIPPDVSLRVIAPNSDPAGMVRGGVEIFRRLKPATAAP